MKYAFAFIFVLLLVGCTQPEPPTTTTVVPTPPPSGETRSHYLGFSPFPYALSGEAYAEGFQTIERDGDMYAMHDDNGVHWEMGLKNSFDAKILTDAHQKAQAIADGHGVYVAMTPINFERDDLADNLDGKNPWRDRLDHPDVITAYINSVEKAIEVFEPDYLAYAIEPNLFYAKKPERWDEFVNLAREVYTTIKAHHPELPVFVTLQAEFFHKDVTKQSSAIRKILPYTDIIAISTYPYFDQADVSLLPDNYFSQITDLAPSKPKAISETSWPAEDISRPYPITIKGSESNQKEYLEFLFDKMDDSEFIIWFIIRDFDHYWESDLKRSALATVAILWKDTGLYDGEGNPRPAHTLWKETLSHSKR